MGAPEIADGRKRVLGREGPVFRLPLASDAMAVLLVVVSGVLFCTVAQRHEANAAVRDSGAALGPARLERLASDLDAFDTEPLPPPDRRAERQRVAAREFHAGGAVQATAPRHASGRRTVVAVATTAVLALPLILVLALCVPPVRRRRRTGEKGDCDAWAPPDGPEDEYGTMVASLAASQAKLRQVADMQGALRRVATLVARGVSPSELFAAVAAEGGHVLKAAHSVIVRFESGETADVVAHWNDCRLPQVMPPLDGQWPIESGTVTAAVRNTERPARMNDYGQNTTAIGHWARATGVRSVVGYPIKVEGRVWGAMLVHFTDAEPTRGVTEDRMEEFVELIGTAIANAQSRSDLLASRARVVAAADESRRRIERDLHDGAQQRLVTLALKLRAVESAAGGPCRERLSEQLGGLVHDLSDILDDLQKVSRGIVPPILRRSGLSPALRSLARHSSVPVRLDTGGLQQRLPERVEVAVYYTVSEALTNVVKHADASGVDVVLTLRNGTVRLSVGDDGHGGADLTRGTGLVGLKDRVEALGGHIAVDSPPGEGTTVLVEIPTEPAGPSPR